MTASYAISVRRASVLPAASSRFSLTTDTLAVRLWTCSRARPEGGEQSDHGKNRGRRERTETDPALWRSDRNGIKVHCQYEILRGVPVSMEVTDAIAAIYKHRWTIEIYFRFFKHVLGCRHLISHNKNGIEIQMGLLNNSVFC
jgi:hypothetical protein